MALMDVYEGASSEVDHPFSTPILRFRREAVPIRIVEQLPELISDERDADSSSEVHMIWGLTENYWEFLRREQIVHRGARIAQEDVVSDAFHIAPAMGHLNGVEGGRRLQINSD
jgi:hypothetical protein